MIHDLYFEVLQKLEALNIPYVIIGAFAGTAYGVTRTTFDIDISGYFDGHQPGRRP